MREFLFGSLVLNAPERKLAVGNKDLDGTVVGDITLDQCLGQLVLDIFLKCPFQRPRTILAVGTGFLDEPGAGFVGQNDLELAILELSC